jgi:Ion channel.
MIKLLYLLLLALFCGNATSNSTNIVFWNSKPFLYTQGNETKGILYDIFTYGTVFCGNYHNYKDFVNYHQIYSTNELFLKALSSNKSNKDILPSHLKDRDVIWAPLVVQESTLSARVISRRKLKLVTFHMSKKLVLVVHRQSISLDYKIAIGLWRCRVVLVSSVIMSLCFGVLLWLFERKTNSAVYEKFVPGTAKSIWCTFVSMSTVGYGDISPVTFIGRCLMVGWIVISLFIVGLMTSMISDTVVGDSIYRIGGEKIAVMENSVAERVANNFNADIVLTKSHKELYDKVRQGHVFGGLLLNEVAAVEQHQLRDDNQENPLRFVREIPIQHPIMMLVPTNVSSNTTYILACMNYYYFEVFESRSSKNPYCKLDLIYISTVWESISTNLLVQSLLGVLVALWIACFVVEFFKLGKGKTETNSDVGSNDGDVDLQKQIKKLKASLLEEILMTIKDAK